MDKVDGQVFLLGNALHVHQAGGVGTRDILCAGGDVAFHLVDTHTAADGLFLDGEHATEAAALVGA